jgi:hypothetical protein
MFCAQAILPKLVRLGSSSTRASRASSVNAVIGTDGAVRLATAYRCSLASHTRSGFINGGHHQYPTEGEPRAAGSYLATQVAGDHR